MSKENNNTKGINFDNLIKYMTADFKQKVANNEVDLSLHYTFSETALMLLEKKIKKEVKANSNPISFKKSNIIDKLKSIFK